MLESHYNSNFIVDMSLLLLNHNELEYGYDRCHEENLKQMDIFTQNFSQLFLDVPYLKFEFT